MLVYDFKMGGKLHDYLIQAGLKIALAQIKKDKELAFDGPTEEEIVTAWQNRLDRMLALQQFFGRKRFAHAREQFLNLMRNADYTFGTQLNFIIGRKEIHAQPCE
jgi:hypothetical protein